MKQVGRPKKQNKNTQLTIDVEKLKSIFERHSQILNKAEKWRKIAKDYFSFQWQSIKKVWQFRNFWKKYIYTVFNKRHVGSKDAEKEDNEEVEEESRKHLKMQNQENMIVEVSWMCCHVVKI